MRTASLVLILSVLTGCVWPHRTERSQEISGTILDERKHDPVQGAKVFLTAHTNVSCLSGSDGRFRLKSTYNWHIGYLFAWHDDFDFPRPEYWRPDITTVHTNYMLSHSDWLGRVDKTILLRKLGEPPTPRPWLLFNGDGEILQDMGARQYLKQGGIRIAEPYSERFDPRYWRIHVGFVLRVYDPHITPVNKDLLGFAIVERKGFDWEFRSPPVSGYDRERHIKDSDRVYRLDFIP